MKNKCASGWRGVMGMDFPKIRRVTVEMQQAADRQRRWMRGSVRMWLGLLPTTDSIEDRHNEALQSPLLDA